MEVKYRPANDDKYKIIKKNIIKYNQVRMRLFRV